MKELKGKTYYRVYFEFVTAAELPESTKFGDKNFSKGDFIVKYNNGTQIAMKRKSFLKHFKECKPATYVYDSIDENKRLIKSSSKNK